MRRNNWVRVGSDVGAAFAGAARLVVRRPGVTIPVLVCVAAGTTVATVTALFLFAVLDPPVPYATASSLVTLTEQQLVREGTRRDRFISEGALRDLVTERGVFRAVAGVRREQIRLTGGPTSPDSRIEAVLGTGEFFAALGARAKFGHEFGAADETSGNTPPIVLSYQAWVRLFGSDSSVIGRTVSTSLGLRQLAGVMPPEFRFPVQGGADAFLLAPASARRSGFTYAIASVRDMNRAQATALEIGRRRGLEDRNEVIARARQSGGRLTAASEPPFLRVEPYSSDPLDSTSLQLIGLIMLCTGAVLVGTILNVVGLWVARLQARRGEFAIRVAVGASAGHIALAAFCESFFLVGLGGALGMIAGIAAYLPVESLLPLLGSSSSLRSTVLLTIVGMVAAVWLGVSMLTSISANRTNVRDRLMSSTRFGSATSARVQAVLVAWQIAFACVVAGVWAMAATQFSRTVASNHSLTDGLSVGRIVPSPTAMPTPANLSSALRALYEAPPPTLELAIGGHPLAKKLVPVEVSIVGGNVAGLAWLNGVSSNYLSLIRASVVSGRMFTKSEEKSRNAVALIGTSTGTRLFGLTDPIGKTLTITVDKGVRVVRVIGTVSGLDPSTSDAKSTGVIDILVPWTLQPDSTTDLILRGLDNSGVRGRLGQYVSQVSGGTAVIQLKEGADFAANGSRLVAVLVLFFSVFGAAGLGLMAIGVTALMAAVVAQRRPEIGVRIALGSTQSRIVTWVLSLHARRMAYGVFIGTGLTIAVASAARSWSVMGVTTAPFALVSGIAAVVIVATTAALLQARIAARVDPVEAMRD